MSTKYSPEELQKLDDNAIYQIAKTDLGIPRCGMMGATELRSAVTAHLSQAGRIDGNAVAATASSKPAAPSKPLGVTAIYPPYNDTFDQLVGKTVSEAVAVLTDVWSIAQGSRVYVNGNQIAAAQMSTVRMNAGDRLEIAKAAAEKG